MRFLMKRNYYQDIRLFRMPTTLFWYSTLVVVLFLLPILLGDYGISRISFISIYSIAAIGLMLLSGYTGQVSLGHAAFFAIGSYTSGILTSNGVPFLLALPLAGVAAVLAGIVIGLPALRLSGLYLAIATMGFAFIVEELLVRWESVTHGNQGIFLEPPKIGDFYLESETSFYYLVLIVLILTVLAAVNILRSPTGRAMIAIRDSETAAQTMGVNLAKYKTTAFAISALFTGLAGSLFAHKLTFISPEIYSIMFSIELLVMIIIGGLGSLHGAIFGAVFVVFAPGHWTDQRISSSLHTGTDRSGIRSLRADDYLVHHVRTHGYLWQMAEDSVLLRIVSSI